MVRRWGGLRRSSNHLCTFPALHTQRHVKLEHTKYSSFFSGTVKFYEVTLSMGEKYRELTKIPLLGCQLDQGSLLENHLVNLDYATHAHKVCSDCVTQLVHESC